MRWNAIQHLSLACRVSHMPKIAGLLSARMLREVTNVDSKLCQVNNHRPLHILVLYFVAVPVILSVVNLEAGIMFFNAIMPSTQYLSIMANFYLNEISHLLPSSPCISPWVCLSVVLSLWCAYLATNQTASPTSRTRTADDCRTGSRSGSCRFQAPSTMAVHSLGVDAQQMLWPEQRDILIEIPHEVRSLLASKWKISNDNKQNNNNNHNSRDKNDNNNQAEEEVVPILTNEERAKKLQQSVAEVMLNRFDVNEEKDDEKEFFAAPSTDQVLSRTAIFALKKQRRDGYEVALAQSLLLYLAPDMVPPLMAEHKAGGEEEEEQLDLALVVSMVPAKITWRTSCLVMTGFLHTFNDTVKQPDVEKNWQRAFQQQAMLLTQRNPDSYEEGVLLLRTETVVQIITTMVQEWQPVKET